MAIEEHDSVAASRSDLADSAAFPARLEQVIGALSVRAFARKAGVSDTFLRQCLAGRTEPTRTKLLAIAEAGGTSVEWLATGGTDGPDAAAASDHSGTDRALLETIFEMTERVLVDSGSNLPPERKARLIVALYDMHAGSNRESISRETVERVIGNAV